MQPQNCVPQLTSAIVGILAGVVKSVGENRGRVEAPAGLVGKGEGPSARAVAADFEALSERVEIVRKRLLAGEDLTGLDDVLEPMRTLDSCLRSVALRAATHWFEILVARLIGPGHVGASFEHGGDRYHFHEYRLRPMFLVTGEVKVRAAYYRREGGGEGLYPLDLILGVDREGCTREAGFLMAQFATETDYPQAEALIERATGLRIDQNRLHRKVEVLGGEAQQLQIEGGPAETREPEKARLVIETDAVMAPMRFDPEGHARAVADPEGKPEKSLAGFHETHVGVVAVPASAEPSPPKYRRKDRSPDRKKRTKADRHPDVQVAEQTYVATYLGRDGHLDHLKAEAVRRGWAPGTQTAVIGDGAVWVHEKTEALFPGATHILDWGHAMEHLAKVRDIAYFSDSSDGPGWYARQETNLWRGDFQALIASIRYLMRTETSKKAAAKIRTELEYFRGRRKIMDYPAYRRAGWPIGSGAVESACRHIVQERCKCSGMRWSPRGINNVLAVRTAIANGRFNELWASHAARSPFKKAG